MIIGGNYYAVLNLTSSSTSISKAQNIDFVTFLDVANLWGVDDKTLMTEVNKKYSWFRVEWFTPVGPLSFSLAAPISKSSTDKTETFRFNLGTTF